VNNVNRLPDVEPVLRAYLADTGDTAPDRVLTDVASRIARQPRQRTWRLRRRTYMNPYAKIGLAAAAVVVLAVAGYALLPRTATGPGSQPTHTPVPTASPVAVLPSPTSPQCEDLIPGCAGALAAGPHRTARFAPSFGYTTPDGWINTIDAPTLAAFSTSFETPDAILVWSGAVPAEKTAACVLQPKAGAGATSADWIAYLDSHPGLDATNIRTLTMGGLTARSIDIRAYGGWTSPCADDHENHNVPILKTPDGAPGDGYGVTEQSMARVYVIDVGSRAVVVTLYAYRGGDAVFTAQVAAAEPIVSSFAFGAP
jgi:hypothetical protein